MRNFKHETYWTGQEVELLTKLVNEGKMSYKKMAQFFKRDSRCLQQKALRLGLTVKYKKHTYEHDSNFWSNINPITAYFAGFSMGDGCVEKHDNGGIVFTIGLNAKDSNILHKLKELTKYTGEVKIKKRFHKMCNKYVDSATFSVCGCHQWCRDLEKYWGVIPHKTFRASPPIINNDYLKLCWLIGMIDADGCLVKKPNETGIKLMIASCNTKILEYCKEILDTIFPELPNTGGGWPKLTRITQAKGTNTYNLDVSNIRAFIIVDYLRQFPLPKFARKWSKPSIIQALEECKTKYPELFYRKLVIPEQYQQYSMPDTLPYEISSESLSSSVISIENMASA